ncbi:hypothetical protein AUJ14_01470 [Candidatus Micrarchaeota archaeon CG1_02_55_22]|nr:MAG: hypothetical protein AUJ14_01470 [Candidatus Micrarchaeota archaeon CG1_02_55_22]
MSFGKLASNALYAFSQNSRWVVLFSLPFLISFPLALLLPNYGALGGIFLRLGSLGLDAGVFELGVMLAAIIIAILFFSFAVASINAIVKAQKTFSKLKFSDFERTEGATLRIFGVYLIAFLAVFAFQLVLFQSHAFSDGVRNAVNAAFALAVALLVLFAPQAIVLDNRGVESSVAYSAKVLVRKPGFVISFLALSVFLVIVNAVLFLALDSVLPFAPVFGIIVNALLIMPFLELLKVQIYLSKYSLL